MSDRKPTEKKTCPRCFRRISVIKGKFVVHNGTERDVYGSIVTTKRCSLSGANALKALIEATEAKVSRAQADLDAAITQVMVAERERDTAQVALNKAKARLDDLVAEQSPSSVK